MPARRAVRRPVADDQPIDLGSLDEIRPGAWMAPGRQMVVNDELVRGLRFAHRATQGELMAGWLEVVPDLAAIAAFAHHYELSSGGAVDVVEPAVDDRAPEAGAGLVLQGPEGWLDAGSADSYLLVSIDGGDPHRGVGAGADRRRARPDAGRRHLRTARGRGARAAARPPAAPPHRAPGPVRVGPARAVGRPPARGRARRRRGRSSTGPRCGRRRARTTPSVCPASTCSRRSRRSGSWARSSRSNGATPSTRGSWRSSRTPMVSRRWPSR